MATMFFITYGIALWLAKGKLSPRHWRLHILWIIIFVVWFLMLYASVRNIGPLARERLVWPLALAETGFVAVGWLWLLRTIATTFQFSWRYHARKEFYG